MTTHPRDMIRLSGFEPDKDIMLEYTGIRPGEKLYEEIMTAEEGIEATRNKAIMTARLSNLRGKDVVEALADMLAVIGEPAACRDKLTELIPRYEVETGRHGGRWQQRS